MKKISLVIDESPGAVSLPVSAGSIGALKIDPGPFTVERAPSGESGLDEGLN